MRLFVDSGPGWPDAAIRRMVDAGAIPRSDGPEPRPDATSGDSRPRTDRSAWPAGPVLRVVSDGRVPDDVRAGDHVRWDARDADASAFADACRRRGAVPWVVASTPAQVRAHGRCAGLWLRGSESAGPVEPYTTLVLLRAARGVAPFVVESLGTRAMAAALAIGAEGVALDAHLWGLPEAPEPCRRLVQGRPSGRDTVVTGELEDRRVRVHARDGVPAPQCLGEAARWAVHEEPGAAIAAIRSALEAHLALPLAAVLRRDPLGTGAPVVQGPMANVSERIGLARAVSAAGGMPFVALGALDPERASAVLAELEALDRPWGAGVIAFDVAPHRDAHLDLVARSGAKGVILAGGSPDLARRTPGAWLHTPSPRLAGQALRRGVRAIVLEGHEAGGHVGALTSAGLWEEALAEVEASEARPLVVLAGGIGDATSAAFAAAMAAPAAARGAEIALQAGTAFFFTHEIVESGQLTPAAQAMALACDRTVLVGSTANLPLRCAPNAFAGEAREAEARLLAGGVPLDERRRTLERANVGRTRIAAKGIERDPEAPAGSRRYRPVPAHRQRAEGAHTLGQGATVTGELRTVAEVVRALSEDAARLLESVAEERSPWGDVRSVAADPSAEVAPAAARVVLGARGPEPIAVVGLGCVLPGAHDLPAFWRNLVHGVDAIAPVPPDRWSIDRYWDPEAGPRGPIASRSRLAGAVTDFAFDPLRFRIPPRIAATMDPAQRLALVAAAEALHGLGWIDDDARSTVDGARAAVILGNSMGGEHVKKLALRVRYRDILDGVRASGVVDLDDAGWRDLEAKVDGWLAERLPPLNANSMAGVLSNVIAGRVASWLDWRGGNLTVDAACASSLAAVTIACDWLRSGRCDVALAGGVDTDLSPETFVGFSLTGALSSGGSRPFGAGADGFVMGEGAAAVVLVRLEDALRDGLPVWAVLRGVGQSADGKGRGITAPRPEGQKLAIERAFAEAGCEPASLGFVEAHGTGTTIGDRTEVAVLRETFADARGVWLGSVKSMVGHLKAAAGAAGLTKAVLSLATGVVPPTLNAGPVEPDLGLAGGPFRLPRAPARLRGTPRRAGVSAFGFGGTNFHAVLEQAPDGARTPVALAAFRALAEPLVRDDDEAAWPLTAAPVRPVVLAFAGGSAEALAAAVGRLETTTPAAAATAAHRAFLVTTEADRERTLARAARGVAGGDVFFGDGTATRVVAVVPGQGTQKPGAVASMRRVMAEDALGVDLDAEEAAAADDTLALHRLMYGLAAGWGGVLRDADVPIAATLGHSLGEYGALALAGRLDAVEGLSLVSARGAALRACPDGAMLAVALPEGPAAEVAAAHGLAVAACNAPHATVLSGPAEAVEAAREALAAARVGAVRVPVVRAFHSPAVAPAQAPLAHALAEVRFAPSPVPVWSGRTARPFADDPRADLVGALVEPVRFADAVADAVATTGARTVVEVGPGRTLARHASARLEGVRCVALDPEPGDPVGIVRAAAALAADGHPGLLLRLVEAGLAEIAGPSAPRAAAPAPEARPRPAPRNDGSDPVRAAVVAALCEVTGYPAEFLDRGADLEGDLGVDSIRRMEVLGLLEERLGFRVPESEYARLASLDLDGLVDWVAARAAPDPHAAAAPPVAASVPAAVAHRYVVRHVPPPPTSGARPLVVDVRGVPAGPVATRARLVVEHVLEAARARGDADAIDVVVGEDPSERAAAGFARTLGREWGVPVRVVAHGAGQRWAEAYVPADPAPLDLPERPVVVASGGATGIVAACLRALADLRPRVLVLGRRAVADLAALGDLEATYAACDVTDAEAVAREVGRARERWGRIDVVLHGAGALCDKPVDRIAPDDLGAVLGPKLDGAAALMAATVADEPALWVAFSSLAADAGNPGQALYGAANAVLDGWTHPTAQRSLTIAWSAWAEIGMAAPLARVLAARGVAPLPPEVGAAAFREVLGRSGRVVVAGHPLPADVWPLAAVGTLTREAVEARVRLDPSDPALADHRVGGRPLVPAAVWVRAMDAAVGLVEGPGPRALDAFAVRAPAFVEAVREDVVVRAERTPEGWQARVLAGTTVLAEATLRCAKVPVAAPPAPLPVSQPAGPLYRSDLLFHGPAWRVLDRLDGDGNGHVRADVAARGLDGLASLVDGAHQLLSTWSGHETGWLGLPVAAGRWILAPGEDSGPVRLELHARATAEGVEGDVTGVDAAGRVVLVGEGVRLRRAARWPSDVADPLAKAGTATRSATDG